MDRTEDPTPIPQATFFVNDGSILKLARDAERHTMKPKIDMRKLDLNKVEPSFLPLTLEDFIIGKKRTAPTLFRDLKETPQIIENDFSFITQCNLCNDGIEVACNKWTDIGFVCEKHWKDVIVCYYCDKEHGCEWMDDIGYICDSCWEVCEENLKCEGLAQKCRMTYPCKYCGGGLKRPLEYEEVTDNGSDTEIDDPTVEPHASIKSQELDFMRRAMDRTKSAFQLWKSLETMNLHGAEEDIYYRTAKEFISISRFLTKKADIFEERGFQMQFEQNKQMNRRKHITVKNRKKIMKHCLYCDHRDCTDLHLCDECGLPGCVTHRVE